MLNLREEEVSDRSPRRREVALGVSGIALVIGIFVGIAVLVAFGFGSFVHYLAEPREKVGFAFGPSSCEVLPGGQVLVQITATSVDVGSYFEVTEVDPQKVSLLGVASLGLKGAGLGADEVRPADEELTALFESSGKSAEHLSTTRRTNVILEFRRDSRTNVATVDSVRVRWSGGEVGTWFQDVPVGLTWSDATCRVDDEG